ncbi:cytochrome c oxidase subunit II [Arhodomonas sp. AD133]|uniref:cytochrome c oxidase subunit II n=1 Tax=Arhodomonas sp. AD133 TaxID=3415009 RepID=UPI003EB6DACC
MIRNKSKAVIGWILAAGLLAAAAPASADLALNMPRGVTETSREVYGLHMIIFWITVVIGIGVFGAIFYSIFKHRKSKGAVPAQFHHNTTIEVVWTVIPLAILIAMAVPATQALIKMEDTGDAEMTIKVTGYQWKWGYEYMDEGVQFFSTLDRASDQARRKDSGIDPASVENYLLEVDNRLVVPTNTKIRFMITSADVIHSWWVPALGWKKDAIPGYINQTWTRIDEPGVYRGQCAELCGRDHAFMPVVIEAKRPEEFQQWLAEQKEGEESSEQAARSDFGDDRVAAR